MDADIQCFPLLIYGTRLVSVSETDDVVVPSQKSPRYSKKDVRSSTSRPPSPPLQAGSIFAVDGRFTRHSRGCDSQILHDFLGRWVPFGVDSGFFSGIYLVFGMRERRFRHGRLTLEATRAICNFANGL